MEGGRREKLFCCWFCGLGISECVWFWDYLVGKYFLGEKEENLLRVSGWIERIKKILWYCWGFEVEVGLVGLILDKFIGFLDDSNSLY